MLGTPSTSSTPVHGSTLLEQFPSAKSGGNPSFWKQSVRINVANWKYFLLWALPYKHRPHLSVLFLFLSSWGELGAVKLLQMQLISQELIGLGFLGQQETLPEDLPWHYGKIKDIKKSPFFMATPQLCWLSSRLSASWCKGRQAGGYREVSGPGCGIVLGLHLQFNI